ncbi:MAG: hypothetical protein WAW42_06025 [Candidatus Competibacteraceae bacterium]
MSPRIDLINPQPKFNPNAECAFLQALPKKEAAQVAESWEKHRRVLEDKETMEGIYNEGKGELGWGMWGEIQKRWKRLWENSSGVCSWLPGCAER